MNEDETKIDKMRDALTSIAREIQTFTNSSITNSCQSLTENEEIFNQVLKYKSLLKSKNKLIKRLQENVKTACIVAKTMISAKENETASLNTLLHLTRSECTALYQKNTKTSRIIPKLTEQNKALLNKLHTLISFVDIGFKQLPNSSERDSDDESSLINKLKEIIIYSGKSSAHYNAECERNTQLEQNNRFLKSKLNKLKNYIEILSKELQHLQHQNIKLKNENIFLQNRPKRKLIDNNNCVSYSECRFDYQSSSHETTKRANVLTLSMASDLDLTVHLSMAKKLLDDQDVLLQDLKYLTQEVITT